MLKELKVQNFALIDTAHIQFQNTLISITGETGAGKSILLDALSLTLGGKADVSLLFDKSKKSIIEAVFDLSKLEIKNLFNSNDLDFHEETTIRRELSADGKSRSFINDTPVNLNVLKIIGEQLIDIHSQHQNLLINTTNFRYNFVDAIADTLKERISYSQLYKQYQKDKKALETLIQQQSSAKKEQDYLQYLFNELEEANIKEGELDQLESEIQQLENAENIIANLNNSLQALKESEVNAIDLIKNSKQNIQAISKFNTDYITLSERLQSAFIEIQDIAHEIESKISQIEVYPEKAEVLTERIDTLNKLLKKHGVKTDKELLDIQKELSEKISLYENADEIISKKQSELEQHKKNLINIAQQLSEKRKHAKPIIEKTITDLLKKLAMPHAQFIINIETTNDLDDYGTDDIKFLFSANKGIAPGDIQKTASGGEISRLMLSIKSLMAKKIQLPTIIFDEIDTGVSGAVAGQMAEIMKDMSEYMQVIVITHLPQIAAKAKQHLYVTKTETNNKTISHIKELDEDNRIYEIAKMLSSGIPGEAAIQNAKELLKNNQDE